MMTNDPITSGQEKRIRNLVEDAASKAAKDVLSSLQLEKDVAQEVIEAGDALHDAIKPLISAKLTGILTEKIESSNARKMSVLIKAGGSNPYFDEQFDYYEGLWRKKLGIKNPNFSGILPFGERPGYMPLILPKSDIITAQHIYDRCKERFPCWKFTSQSLDEVVVKNDRDPRAGAYVIWFRALVEADEDLKNLHS